jgi:hypothetical protein
MPLPMKECSPIAIPGAVIGDPARASILCALMAGRAMTAGELARCCYDHRAGEMGVELHDTLTAQGCFMATMDGIALATAGIAGKLSARWLAV